MMLQRVFGVVLVVCLLVACAASPASQAATPILPAAATAAPYPSPNLSYPSPVQLTPILGSPPPDHAPVSPIPPGSTAPRLTYQVLQRYPHDPTAWTQGLIWIDDQLFEGTGRNGQSSLRRVELSSGAVLQRVDLPAEYYGEGIAVVGQRIYQLTWQSRKGFIYDRSSFQLQGEFAYQTEGWGLSYDGQYLMMSDGSSTISFRDPQTFAEVRRIVVSDHGTPIAKLNELEYVDGVIYANIWQTDWIVQIDPADGRVLGWIDLRGLLTESERIGADVLNGIAYNPTTQQFLLTGKLWPRLFAVRFVPR